MNHPTTSRNLYLVDNQLQKDNLEGDEYRENKQTTTATKEEYVFLPCTLSSGDFKTNALSKESGLLGQRFSSFNACVAMLIAQNESSVGEDGLLLFMC